MFCVKQAFEAAGYSVSFPASVNRDDLPSICKKLGVKLIGYYSSRAECEDPSCYKKYLSQLRKVKSSEPVIVIYTTHGVTGHAEFFPRFKDVPAEKQRGFVITGL